MLPRAPFVGIVLFYIAGILLSSLFPAFLHSQIIFFGIICACFLVSMLCYAKSFKSAFGVTFAMFSVAIGGFSKTMFEQRNDTNIAALNSKTYTAYEAEITTLPEKRAKTVRFEAIIKRIRINKQWLPVSVKALINVSDDATSIPKPGEWVIVSGTLEQPMEAKNPMQFDYRAFLRNKGIVWTDYLSNNSFTILPGEQTFVFQRWSTNISEWSAQVLRENIPDDDAYGLVKAMLLGRRDDLQADLVTDYTASGAVHILSVSGMHVAIIFLVISHLLGWIKRWHYGKWLYLVAVIALLCFYALVTGLPASVQRATLMCIVFVVAEVFARKQNAMNTLAFSAFLILLFDPAALYDVGFQLSYLAMSGIFLLYEPINNFFTPNNRIIKFVWQISALSFAAQLATFPLSLFYFHQFPSYFWLINPFVIAFTNVLLPAALLLLLVSLVKIFWLQWLVNQIVLLSAYLTNVAVSVPKSLPGYLIENLNLDKVEVVILYAVLLLIWLTYEKRSFQFLKAACLVVFMFACYGVSKSLQIRLSNDVVTHSIPNHLAMSFKQNDVLYVVSDKALREDANAYNFCIRNYAISQEVQQTVFVTAK
ncbi:ComEC/Rec2 family competence protein [Dyadobacter sp. CY326]|uniref:ComEC/Rec2 family competence protein n=1 Tax=Dyadobacter sp. CY326 TaxID=2907300 RepID=UPI001F46FC2F|nr:ComEC/Rec2 family competence protein [Dyadobacter sp. CY326]MCE7064738.1 competence protein ComEC family protein [Dyadobacter sp. CY326]